VLRERIDELSEELELARAAAAAEAAAAEAAAAADQAHSGTHTGAGSRKDSMQCDPQQLQQQQGDLQAGQLSPGGELSQREVGVSRQVPLMGEDTPLEALHAQVSEDLSHCSSLHSRTAGSHAVKGITWQRASRLVQQLGVTHPPHKLYALHGFVVSA
jgi:hypothetical protein